MRIVVNTKASLVTAASRKFERTLLPRATDVVEDALELMSGAEPERSLEFFIADFADGFTTLHNSVAERRFFLIYFHGE